jgi:hypothetical protein
MSKQIKRDRLADFQNSWSYKHILEDHSLDEYGIWQVFGEDSNCDMGGSHYMPELGLYEGKLADVIAIAVELPNFWQWGSGGDIRKSKVVKPIKVDAETNAKRDAIKQKIANLNANLKMAQDELAAL